MFLAWRTLARLDRGRSDIKRSFTLMFKWWLFFLFMAHLRNQQLCMFHIFYWLCMISFLSTFFFGFRFYFDPSFTTLFLLILCINGWSMTFSLITNSRIQTLFLQHPLSGPIDLSTIHNQIISITEINM